MAGSDIRAGRAYVELYLKDNTAAGLSQASQKLQAGMASMIPAGEIALKMGVAKEAVRMGVASMSAVLAALRGDWEEVGKRIEDLPFHIGHALGATYAFGKEAAQMLHQLWRGTGKTDLEQDATDYANSVQTKREALEKLTEEMTHATAIEGASPHERAVIHAQDTFKKESHQIDALAAGMVTDSNGQAIGHDAGSVDAARAAAAEKLRVALAAIPPVAEHVSEKLTELAHRQDQAAQVFVGLERELATLGMNAEEKQLFDLKGLQLAGDIVERIAALQGKVTAEKQKQAVAAAVEAAIAAANRETGLAGKTPTEAKLYDLAHPAGGGAVPNEDQLARARAAFDAAEAATKAAGDLATKKEDMAKFVAEIEESLKTPQQELGEYRRKLLDANAAGLLTISQLTAASDAAQVAADRATGQGAFGPARGIMGSAAIQSLQGGGDTPAKETAKATKETAQHCRDLLAKAGPLRVG